MQNNNNTAKIFANVFFSPPGSNFRCFGECNRLLFEIKIFSPHFTINTYIIHAWCFKDNNRYRGSVSKTCLYYFAEPKRHTVNNVSRFYKYRCENVIWSGIVRVIIKTTLCKIYKYYGKWCLFIEKNVCFISPIVLLHLTYTSTLGKFWEIFNRAHGQKSGSGTVARLLKYCVCAVAGIVTPC